MTVMSERPGRIDTRQVVVALGVVVLPGLAGLAVGTGHGIEAIAVVGVSLFVALGLFNWRRSVYGLLMYLPFSGIPIIAAYPRTALATLAKDVLFVIPAYLGFLGTPQTDERRVADHIVKERCAELGIEVVAGSSSAVSLARSARRRGTASPSP